ncbi:putative membrane protein C14C4.07 [Hypsizygus marmoreus]|uniref:Membrane protein C14C4.07 n=1 Tax=Hypsizygus marmoreus TaxID=39966 RepID=A0A369K3B2_HYPMA|nr:putative membrane protein C14C4.07 [Hypsizygus marmoreus]
MDTEAVGEIEQSVSVVRQASEADPLLGEGGDHARKPFYRARPLWLVPFAITAALVRGMTLAPRIEVFTQLSCNRLHGHDRYNHTHISSLIPTTGAIPQNPSARFLFSLDSLGPQLHPQHQDRRPYYNVSFATDIGNDDDNADPEEDPRRLPSSLCLSDPAVQAGAARLQTVMTTTMGLLSALTTGWWGHFGERHGRTKVLATATFGLFLTDLMFILVSTPSSIFATHGHKLLVVAPVIEGLLGGWSTLQSATSAYLSDCTSSGSRAHIFSRFFGVFYFGLSVGPSIGGYLIQHPIMTRSEMDGVPTVTSVFWVAVLCSFINFLLVLFVFPESLNQEKRELAITKYHAKTSGKGKARADNVEVVDGLGGHEGVNGVEEIGIIRGFMRPLALFLPAVILEGGVKKRTDWSLTFLAAALFGAMLSSGVHQVKYLYAEHVYGWGAEQLSYYISFIGGARAMFLLFLMPWIIGAFKPKPQPKPNTGTILPPPSAGLTIKGKKPRLTKALLAREISFDLLLARLSLLVDILSNTFVMLAPMPSFKVDSLNGSSASLIHSKEQSQAMFVLATTLSSLGTGVVPAIQSLALCIMQVRALDSGKEVADGKEEGVGELFGALAVLQTVGQMILSPMLFGLIYSGTVAAFPKAVFATAGGILICSFGVMMLVRGPTMPSPGRPVIGIGKGKGKKKAKVADRKRGDYETGDQQDQTSFGKFEWAIVVVAILVSSTTSQHRPRPCFVSVVDVLCLASAAAAVLGAMNTEANNAVAGPSNSRPSPPPSSPHTPQLFLPPPGQPDTHPTYLSSTQDLLARFYLLPAYDKYVRPFAAPGETGLDQLASIPLTPGTTGGLDKGKGKEVVGTPGTPGVHDAGDGDDEEGGKGDKKKRNNYKHLIKGIPGKHSMKKDDYLSTMMQVPPKQRIHITPFDTKTQREAFTVSLEGLKGWNPNALVLESAQAREDRKRRKETKRLQKLQAQAQMQAALASPVAQPQTIQAPIPTSATASSFSRGPPPTAVVTNGVPRPGSTIPPQTPLPPGPTSRRTASAVPRPGSTAPKPVARPGSTVPMPGSAVLRPGSTKPILPPVQVPAGKVATPLRSALPGTPLRSAGPPVLPTAPNAYSHAIDNEKRGKKRERDDVVVNGAVVVNGVGPPNTNAGVPPAAPKPIFNAKAGIAGARPRPIKKQRMDIQGQARDVTVTQQPTPQGV